MEPSTTCSLCHTPLPAEARFCATCGAHLSDPDANARQRAAMRELFDAVTAAVAGRYRVTDVLGRGGMGAVFLAEDLRLGRRVAIKVLRPELAEDEAFIRRFEREARIAAGLDHPNIVPIYGVEQTDDLLYFVMKYVGGTSLDALLAGGPLPPEQARRILAQAAEGLGHAHQRGVIHRDVKPPNLLVDDTGHVHIADFGISKALQAETQYTSTGQVVGTPSYLSPEQAQGLPLDGRSDQYSLAVVGYEMMVGRLPLESDSIHALLYKHIHEMPVPAREARPDVPQDLSDTLQRALAKEPGERFASMEEFAVAVSAGAPADRSAAQRRARRRAAAVAAAVLVVAGGVGLALQRDGETPGAAEEVSASPGAVQDSLAGARAEPNPASPAPSIPAPAPPDTVPSAGVAAPSPDSSAAARPDPPPKPKPRPRSPATSDRARADSVAAAGPAAARAGYLTVNANPYGTVWIDDVEAGDTPIVGRELSPGQHAIRVTREGFRPETATVTITPGNEVRLSRTLVRQP